MRRVLVLVVVIASLAVPGRAAASTPWMWPVVGAIVQGYDPPDDLYGAGHRGIDIAAPPGSVVVAPDDGVVSFAGPVGGRLFLSIDHGGGVVSTSSFLTSLLVRKGDTVVRAQPVASTGWGHAAATVPHLHFGVRLDGEYVDPFAYLGPPSVAGFIRLAPLGVV
jgi:murein DD-endopeptidase MepM/ murein hydrolase activator NlpD